MAARKLHYYISNADTTICSDHMPLRKFLMKNTKNATVNNWAVAIEDYNLKFEYIKGVKNTLADTMSHLVLLDPDTALLPELDHEEFRKPREGELGGEEEIHALIPGNLKLKEEGSDGSPFRSMDLPTWGLPDADVREAQSRDGLCQRLLRQADRHGEKAIHPYYLDKSILMRYITDNKQRFEAMVVPLEWGPMLLKLAHDDLGHNGTARTYMILRRNYYWKGMKAYVALYVKRCSLCRKHNGMATRYVKGSFEIPKAPMDFISMDLIGEFHPPQHEPQSVCAYSHLHVDRLGMVHSPARQDSQCSAESIPPKCAPCVWSFQEDPVRQRNGI